jgi:hypothetical protein
MSATYLDELKARNRSRESSQEEGIQMETFPRPSQIARRRHSNIERDMEETNSIDYFEVAETSTNRNGGNQNITKIVQRDTVYIYKNGYIYVCMAGLAFFMAGLFALNDYILISYTNINWV